MYAVVATGGKQVRLAQGDTVRVEFIDAPVGEQVVLDDVKLLAGNDGVIVDPDQLGQARVICQVLNQDKAKKIRVFKKKRRKGYKRLYGHRQMFTELRVRSITTEPTQ